jgi:hypothetical protein
VLALPRFGLRGESIYGTKPEIGGFSKVMDTKVLEEVRNIQNIVV